MSVTVMVCGSSTNCLTSQEQFADYARLKRKINRQETELGSQGTLKSMYGQKVKFGRRATSCSQEYISPSRWKGRTK